MNKVLKALSRIHFVRVTANMYPKNIDKVIILPKHFTSVDVLKQVHPNRMFHDRWDRRATFEHQYPHDLSVVRWRFCCGTDTYNLTAL